MTSVLAILDHDRGAVSNIALTAIAAAHEVAAGMGLPVHVAVAGDGAMDAAVRAAEYGAEIVHHLTSPHLGDYNPEAWGEAFAQLVEERRPAVVISAADERGNELMAQVAARTDLPFVSNCISVSVDVSSMIRSQWGGALHEEASLDAAIKLISITPGATEAAPAPAAGLVNRTEVTIRESLTRSVIKDRSSRPEGITLATAPVVVGGGRGVGSKEGFSPLDDLATELGGKVGCSRAVTNNGWRPHSDQVGQTGTRIAPTLYIASGISGATQHWVGAMGSKNILAINIDPDANMVTRAGWAVIADLHEMIPAITDELRRRKR